LFNRVAKENRFIAKIIVKNIPGRIRAKEIEANCVATYKKKHGSNPRGNL